MSKIQNNNYNNKVRRVLTYETCREITAKYDNYTDLNQLDPSVINKIKHNGWLELISHLTIPYSVKNIKWTYENCKLETAKMVYLSELQGTSLSTALIKNGWYAELTSHLIRKQSKPFSVEEITKEALKYNTRVDFQKKSSSRYTAGLRMGILDQICSHMRKPLTVKQYSKEEMLQSALKYNNQKDWLLNEPKIFRCARGYNNLKFREENKAFWLLCISHMEYVFKPNGYWTYDRCKEITEKYINHSEFCKKHKSVYTAIKKYGWNQLLDHMLHQTINGTTIQSSTNFDTIEKCTREALKYETRSEMCRNSNLAYSIIHKNNWANICLSHMKRQANLKQRYIYAFEFNTTTPKYAYVGLTCQLERRKNAHLYGTDRGKSAVFEKINETNTVPNFKLITPEPIKEEYAPEIEGKWMEEYKNMGYILLNKAKAGSLGSMKSKYTYDYFLKIKENCMTREEFSMAVPVWVRAVAVEHGWWSSLISDMVKTRKLPKEWNQENALEAAKKYECVSKLQKSESGLYKFLDRNKLLKTVFPKTLAELRYEKYNNKDICRTEALKYNNKAEFRLKSCMYYKYSSKNGWLAEICSHMKTEVRPVHPRKSKWTLELIKEKALNCRNISELEKKHSGAYKVAKKNGYMNQLCFSEKQIKVSKWTLELIKETALKCRNISDLQKKYSGAYKVVKKLGYVNQLCFDKNQTKASKWTLVLIKETALKCRNISEFQTKYGGAYKVAKKNDYVNQLRFNGY
jgi:hypothetical protein